MQRHRNPQLTTPSSHRHERIVANGSQKDAAIIRLQFGYHAFYVKAKELGYHTGASWTNNGSQRLATTLINEGAKVGYKKLGTTVISTSPTPRFEDTVRKEVETFTSLGALSLARARMVTI